MPRPPIADAVCQTCKVTFHPSHRRKNKFCSLRCYWKYKAVHKIGPPSRRTRPDSTCLECHEAFYTPRKPKKIFCSRPCFRVWMRRHSPQGFLWPERTAFRGKEWRRIRQEIKQRDDHSCQECGQEGGWLEVHHIKPFHSFQSTTKANDAGNLVTLCRRCHFRVEFGSSLATSS